MKIASDVTEQYLHAESQRDLLTALNQNFAVIEFEPDGTIISANSAFLKTMGYSLDQIKANTIACSALMSSISNINLLEKLGGRASLFWSVLTQKQLW